MIFSTVPGMEMLGRSTIRPAARFRSMILADLAIRGFAISFLTRARVTSRGSLFAFLCRMYSSWQHDGSHTAPFRTVTKYGLIRLPDRFHFLRWVRLEESLEG